MQICNERPPVGNQMKKPPGVVSGEFIDIGVSSFADESSCGESIEV